MKRIESAVSGPRYNAYFEAKDANEMGIVINELIDKLDERKPSVSEFVAGFELISYTSRNTKQSNLVRYILQKLASHQKLAFADDVANLTIEHIYPQAKINNKWTAEIVGSLGNLILLTQGDNGELKDDDFKKKIQVLKKLNSSVPDDVLSVYDWTIEGVEARTQELAKIAFNQIWTIR